MNLSILNFFSMPDEVIRLGKLCDGLEAVHRFWMGEHHSTGQVPDALTMAMLIAGTTSRVRVGTGATSLFFRNPYMISEAAILAELFFPGRIDLGVTKAGTGDEGPAAWLLDGLSRSDILEGYERRLTLLRNILARESNLTGLFLKDGVPLGPNMFVMGTTGQRAKHAGELGVGFVASYHHGGTADSIRAMMKSYRDHFRPSPWFDEPHGIVVVSGYVSEDPEKRAAAVGAEKELLKQVKGILSRTVSVYGEPAQAARDLRSYAAAATADEVMFLSIHGDCDDSYRSLATAWSLGR